MKLGFDQTEVNNQLAWFPAMCNKTMFTLLSENVSVTVCFFGLCRLSPGIEELVKKLRANKIDVYLISGGFRQMINVLLSDSISIASVHV